MRINFFNSKLLSSYAKITSILLAIESFVFLFVELPEKFRIPMLIISLVIFGAIYIVMYICACKITEKTIKVGSTTVKIKFGDLFKEDGLKVIASNEFFDSEVDEVLISSNTLHGNVIKNHIKDVKDMDKKLEEDSCCNSKIINPNYKRARGKTKQYELGTCFKYDKFIFVAFTKFDDQNRAYIELPNYLYCLSNFWIELNRVYDAQNIVVPLLGSGITRLKDFGTITKQEQLELLVNSLKYTNLTFSHDISITIVLPENLKEEISIYKL